MKRIIMLIVLVILISNCTAFEISNRMERERGVECKHNKRGGLENCRYIN